MKQLIQGLVSILIGISILIYFFYKRSKSKDINDFRLSISGFGFLLLGIYIMYQSIKE